MAAQLHVDILLARRAFVPAQHLLLLLGQAGFFLATFFLAFFWCTLRLRGPRRIILIGVLCHRLHSGRRRRCPLRSAKLAKEALGKLADIGEQARLLHLVLATFFLATFFLACSFLATFFLACSFLATFFSRASFFLADQRHHFGRLAEQDLEEGIGLPRVHAQPCRRVQGRDVARHWKKRQRMHQLAASVELHHLDQHREQRHEALVTCDRYTAFVHERGHEYLAEHQLQHAQILGGNGCRGVRGRRSALVEVEVVHDHRG